MPYPIKNLTKYYRPTSIREACELLKEDERLLPLAGGSAIYLLSKMGLFSDIEGFVDLNYLNLNFINQYKNGIIEIGATTTLYELFLNLNFIKGIINAIKAIPKEVRNIGTVGGQVFIGFPKFELEVALMSLDAEIVITDGVNFIQKPYKDFYKSLFTPDIERGYLIYSVRFNINNFNFSDYSRFSLSSHTYSLVSVGIAGKIVDNVIEKINIAVGGGIETPVTRLYDVEEELKGYELSEDSIEKVKFLVQNSPYLKPSDDLWTSAEYKRKVFGVLIKQLLNKLFRGFRK